MRILITGGAGFIGSYLCDLLLKGGHEVICMDNLITGSRNNIAEHLKNKKFKDTAILLKASRSLQLETLVDLIQ